MATPGTQHPGGGGLFKVSLGYTASPSQGKRSLPWSRMPGGAHALGSKHLGPYRMGPSLPRINPQSSLWNSQPAVCAHRQNTQHKYLFRGALEAMASCARHRRCKLRMRAMRARGLLGRPNTCRTWPAICHFQAEGGFPQCLSPL